MQNKPIIDQMAEELLISKGELLHLAKTSPYRYKVFRISKRKQGAFRIIAQPAREVKRLQCWLLNNILNRVAIHPSATAYAKGKNIRQNAEIHLSNSFLLKLDFKDFFPSIKSDDFKLYVQESKDLDIGNDEVKLITKILFWKQKGKTELQLSIGAPTSPCLSNILMREFDKKIFEICKKEKVLYSRYADDLTFSAQNKMARNYMYGAVIDVVKDLKSPQLSINTSKTLYVSRSNRRRVCGLILTPDEKISLGREKKREISAMIHYVKIGRLATDKMKKIRGLLAFASDVEPSFVRRMEEKYGQVVIEKIKRSC